MVSTESRTKPQAVIVDIDGTLAHATSRDWWDFTRVGEDRVDPGVSYLVTKLFPDMRVIIVTGRDDTCRADTVEWLNVNHIPYDCLFMRDPERKVNGNKVADHLLKEEIYLKFVEPWWDVLFVLDDRNSVVDMWRRLGLACYQVAPGKF